MSHAWIFQHIGQYSKRWLAVTSSLQNTPVVTEGLFLMGWRLPPRCLHDRPTRQQEAYISPVWSRGFFERNTAHLARGLCCALCFKVWGPGAGRVQMRPWISVPFLLAFFSASACSANSLLLFDTGFPSLVSEEKYCSKPHSSL